MKQSVSALFSQVYGRNTRPPHPSHTLGLRAIVPATSLRWRPSSSSPCADSNSGDSNRNDISFAETKKLMKLVTVEALKRKLGMEVKEVIDYSELLQACESMGVARSREEAAAFARVLDEAGVVLLFRDKVYLHPHKVSSFLSSHYGSDCALVGAAPVLIWQYVWQGTLKLCFFILLSITVNIKILLLRKRVVGISC